jgi:apolipoprotein N-acyltransferase
LNFSGFLNVFPSTIKYIGSYGLTYLLITFNVLIFEIIYARFNDKKIKLKYLAFLLILFIHFFFPYSIFQNDKPTTDSIKVMGVQGYIKQDWVERSENKTENLKKYLSLTENGIKKYQPDVVLWPEYTFTNVLQLDFPTLNILKSFSKQNNLSLIVGSIFLNNLSSTNSKRYDTLYIFENNSIQNYNAYEPVRVLDTEAIRAEKNENISIKGYNTGLILCYEEMFPYIFTKQINENDVGLFFTIGNQYYISSEHGLKITSLNSKLRAAENNRYVFRLETSGLSTIFNNHGETIKSIPMNKEGVIYYEIPIIKEKTFYTKYRIFIELMLLLFSAILILFNIKNIDKYCQFKSK